MDGTEAPPQGRLERARNSESTRTAQPEEFIENEGAGEPPLEGSLPDMTSLTEFYVSLQKIYQAKAESDCRVMEHCVRTILNRIGREPDSISKSFIKNFCRNARKLTISLPLLFPVAAPVSSVDPDVVVAKDPLGSNCRNLWRLVGLFAYGAFQTQRHFTHKLCLGLLFQEPPFLKIRGFLLIANRWNLPRSAATFAFCRKPRARAERDEEESARS
ncbi:NEDD8-activating enzyme E1 regulatory subunit [Platanthera guangdongensis]|uniref:NEDD8-activating enzyme E1 regulatory subunit n=1 Tax=Platanthera guangdongensis TaxID=2320717 RepID=A0ABR2MVB4_9ASPA